MVLLEPFVDHNFDLKDCLRQRALISQGVDPDNPEELLAYYFRRDFESYRRPEIVVGERSYDIYNVGRIVMTPLRIGRRGEIAGRLRLLREEGYNVPPYSHLDNNGLRDFYSALKHTIVEEVNQHPSVRNKLGQFISQLRRLNLDAF